MMRKILFFVALSGFVVLCSGCMSGNSQQDTAVYHKKTLTEIAGESENLNCTLPSWEPWQLFIWINESGSFRWRTPYSECISEIFFRNRNAESCILFCTLCS